MLSIKLDSVVGLEHAIRGMRNPLNSWDQIDSTYNRIGEKDLKRMTDLAKAGRSHAKYRRMIVVYVDIIAPLYWWKEFDTYKVGTVSNSCSTMHKIDDKEFTLDDFSHEHLNSSSIGMLTIYLETMNANRRMYQHLKDKQYWWQMIQLLPSSYNQKRTIMLNYEVLYSMYKDRKNHKLDEWVDFCKWIESLPYHELITLNGYSQK